MLIYKYIRDLYSLLDSLFFKSQVGIVVRQPIIII